MIIGNDIDINKIRKLLLRYLKYKFIEINKVMNINTSLRPIASNSDIGKETNIGEKIAKITK